MIRKKILIVEDNRIVAEEIKNALEGHDYEVVGIMNSGIKGLISIQKLVPDLVLMNIELQGEIDGITAAERISTEFGIPVIFLAAYANEEMLDRAKMTGPFGYLFKPFQDKELYSTVDMALFKHGIEEQLREKEARIRQVNENIHDIIYAIDESGRIVFASGAIQKITGLSIDDVLEKSVLELAQMIGLSDDKIDELKANYRSVIAFQGETMEYEISINIQGKQKVLEIREKLEYDGNGNFLRLSGTIRDITVKRKAEEELEREKEYYRSFVETFNDWVWEMDLEGIHTYSNPSVKNLLGYELEEIIGHSTLEMWPDKYRTPEKEAWMRSTLAAGKGWKNLQCMFNHKNGTLRYFESTAIPIWDSRGTLIGYRGIDRDITEERRMREAQQELEKMKSDFMLLVSHELGTPLMIITQWLEILQDELTNLNGNKRTAYDIIMMNIERIKKLKNAMFHLTLLEQGKFRPNKEVVFIHHLIKNVVLEFSHMAKEHGIQVIQTLPEFSLANMDKKNIYEVISILLENAIKYTPMGGTVEITGIDHDDSIEIVIRDNGIGISPIYHNKIFEKFFQIEDIMGHNNGFGLGLSVAKGIIESHGGDIRVESGMGKGSSFHFTISKDLPGKQQVYQGSAAGES